MSDIELGPKCLTSLEADITETYNIIDNVVFIAGMLFLVSLLLMLISVVNNWSGVPAVVVMFSFLLLWTNAFIWRRFARLRVDLVLFSCPLPLSTQMKVWLKSRG